MRVNLFNFDSVPPVYSSHWSPSTRFCVDYAAAATTTRSAGKKFVLSNAPSLRSLLLFMLFSLAVCLSLCAPMFCVWLDAQSECVSMYACINTYI